MVPRTKVMSMLMMDLVGDVDDDCLSIPYMAIIYLRSTPHPVTVTTRIITFLVGNPYKPSFATVTGWGVDPIYTHDDDDDYYYSWRRFWTMI